MGNACRVLVLTLAVKNSGLAINNFFEFLILNLGLFDYEIFKSVGVQITNFINGTYIFFNIVIFNKKKFFKALKFK